MRPVLMSIFMLVASSDRASATEVELATWARSLPTNFSVSGSKTEPNYVAAIDIWRDGDRLTIRGGAPIWMERSVETVSVDARGAITHRICPPGMMCTGAVHPAGFLATAALIAALRMDQLAGWAEIEPFGQWQVVCVPGEMLSITQPILDPCFELTSGAAIAQKHRLNHHFDGPTLDPMSIRLD